MHLPLLLIMWTFMGVAAAQSHCDPLTQYEDKGQCCNMCGPGSSMTSLSTCREPQCKECEDGEYQDKYTNAPKCQRQPYCDPNRNFVDEVHKSKKVKSPCMCKPGFHCSSKECITCVPHTACPPGFGAQTKGSHAADTVCQKCEEGTFSNETSWDGECMKWTECEKGSTVQQSGTDTSDNICVETRDHTLAIILTIIVCSAVLAVILCYLHRAGKLPCRPENAKGYAKPFLQEDPKPREDIKPQQEPPTCIVMTPEENEDDPSFQEMSTDVHSTENGNCVTQETGKTEALSQEDTQPQTYHSV